MNKNREKQQAKKRYNYQDASELLPDELRQVEFLQKNRYVVLFCYPAENHSDGDIAKINVTIINETNKYQIVSVVPQERHGKRSERLLDRRTYNRRTRAILRLLEDMWHCRVRNGTVYFVHGNVSEQQAVAIAERYENKQYEKHTLPCVINGKHYD